MRFGFLRKRFRFASGQGISYLLEIRNALLERRTETGKREEGGVEWISGFLFGNSTSEIFFSRFRSFCRSSFDEF